MLSYLIPSSFLRPRSFREHSCSNQRPIALTSHPQQVVGAQAEISVAAIGITAALAWYTGRGLSYAIDPRLMTRLRQAAHGISAVGLLLSLGTQIYAISHPDLPFLHLRIILDPAAQGVASVVLPSLFVPAFLVWCPHLALLCLVNLTLLPIVGLEYEAALAKDSHECLNAVRLEGFQPWEWAIWGLLVVAVIGVVLLSWSQYLLVRQAAAIRTQQDRRATGRADTLYNPTNGGSLTKHLKHGPER